MSESPEPEIIFMADERLGGDSGDGQIRCKFVVLRRGDVFLLVIGPLSRFVYHADILDAFCTQRGILTRWQKRPDQLELLDPALVICGGGYVTLNRDLKSARFGGSSKAYGQFRLSDVDAVLAATQFFRDYKIEFDDR